MEYELNTWKETIELQKKKDSDNDGVGEIYWNSELISGKTIPFTFSFSDENNISVNDFLFVYVIPDSSGKEVLYNIGTGKKYLGILANDVIYQESIFIPRDW